MGNEQGNTLSKDGRVIHLHKSNGVYHVRATALSELCPLEDQDPRNDDAPPAEAVDEANVPGYLDFWGHQEVMIKCDEEQSMKRIAELLQERRRPRRTIVEYNPMGSHQSNGVVENAHYHLEVC